MKILFYVLAAYACNVFASNCESPDKNATLLSQLKETLLSLNGYEVERIEIMPDYGKVDRKYDDVSERALLLMKAQDSIRPAVRQVSTRSLEDACMHSPEIHLSVRKKSGDGNDQSIAAICLLPLAPVAGGFYFAFRDCTRFTSNVELANRLNNIGRLGSAK